jgi:hypothetical protein
MQNPNQARHNSKKTSRIFGGYDNEISCKMPVFPGKPFLLPFFVSTAAGKSPLASALTSALASAGKMDYHKSNETCE